MRTAVFTVVALIAGAGAGALSAVAMAGLLPIGGGASDFEVDVDGWRSDWSIGDRAANLYVRARIARHGLLALRKTEAVYFTRSRDDAGRPLVESCDYRISGGRQDAVWWSVTLYDGESRLPMNTDEALSVDQTRVGDVQSWSAIISARPPDDDANWISSRAAGRFDLTLRLYKPSGAVLDAPAAHLSPPRVTRLGCEETSA
ncbi:MAG: DUF1214 domain-containing protein [Pseudomonadota bacterium]